MSENGWEIVETVGTEAEAALLAGFLQNEEIPARIESRSFRQEPVNFGRMAEVRIWVPEHDLATARRLLAERRHSFTLPEEP